VDSQWGEAFRGPGVTDGTRAARAATASRRSRGAGRAAAVAASVATLACACGPLAPPGSDGSAPVVAGTVDRDVGPAPLRACFDAGESGAARGGPIAIVWDLGDGSARVAGPVACHTYAEPGSYAASVEATDAAGRSAMVVLVVTATAP
jgi:PKD domain-containing protein